MNNAIEVEEKVEVNVLLEFEQVSFGYDKSKTLLKGQDMKHLTIKERSEFIGVVLQNPNQMLSKPMLYDEVALVLRNQGVLF